MPFRIVSSFSGLSNQFIHFIKMAFAASRVLVFKISQVLVSGSVNSNIAFSGVYNSLSRNVISFRIIGVYFQIFKSANHFGGSSYHIFISRTLRFKISTSCQTRPLSFNLLLWFCSYLQLIIRAFPAGNVFFYYQFAYVFFCTEYNPSGLLFMYI